MLSFYLDYSFAMLRRWQLLDRLYVSGGGEAALTLGGLYNLRNSNNPATAKAAIDLGATAMAISFLYITIAGNSSLSGFITGNRYFFLS